MFGEMMDQGFEVLSETLGDKERLRYLGEEATELQHPIVSPEDRDVQKAEGRNEIVRTRSVSIHVNPEHPEFCGLEEFAKGSVIEFLAADDTVIVDYTIVAMTQLGAITELKLSRVVGDDIVR